MAPLQSATVARGEARGLLRWWWHEILAALPETVRRAAGLEAETVLVSLDDQGASGRRPGRTEWIDAAALAAIDRTATVLTAVVPTGDLLARHTTLPRQAGGEMRSVLAFEMERLTPFRAEDVYFDAIATERAEPERRLDIDLWAVPRDKAHALLNRLRAAGLAVEALVACEGDRVVARFAAAGLAPPPAARGRWFRLAVLATLLGAVAAVCSPLYRLERTLAHLDRDITQLRRELDQGGATRSPDQLAALQVAALARARYDQPSLLALLDSLARVLPDGTWLNQFTYSGGEIAIEGNTPASSQLVPLLEAAGPFAAVGFTAPVVRDPSGDGERFSFSLVLRGRP